MVNVSLKRSLLLLVTALVCMLPFWSRSAHADSNVDYGELVVSVLVDGGWAEQGSLPYGRFISEKTLQLTHAQADQPIVLKLVQQGGGKAHLDSVVLGAQSPIEVNGDTHTYVQKLSAADQDLINVEASSMILKFPRGNASSILKINARVEPEEISKIPFHYPTSNLYKDFDLNSEYYTYPINSSRGNLVMDGQLNEISSRAPFFQQYTIPDSGHPEGITYGWVWNDDANLYVAIDFTSDNTFDGEADYTKVYVKTSSGVKEFKVSVPETTWGQPFFTYSDKVSYQHKVYEYQIPFASLDIAENQTELQLGFAAYGTAAAGIISATDNDDTHIGVDRRDITVQWYQDYYNANSTYNIYILPSGAVLDASTQTPIADTLAHETTSWTGTSSNTTDSAGNRLTGGSYMVCLYVNSGNLTGPCTSVVSLNLKSDVDVTQFTAVDNYAGTQDKLQGSVNAVGEANLTMQAYLWTDNNLNSTVDPGELGTAIPLGTSAADGSVNAADIGDLAAGTYKFVITATSNGIESAKDAAHVTTVTLTKGVEPLDITVNSISSSNPTAGAAKIGDTVIVTFTSNRELSGLPNVYIGDGGSAVTAATVSGNVYSAARTFTAADVEGNVRVFFTASAPGTSANVNTTTDGSGHGVNFDKTAPVGTLSINSGAATTSSASVTLTVTGIDPDGLGGGGLTSADKLQTLLVSNDKSIFSIRGLVASMKVAVPFLPAVPGTGNVQMSFSNDNAAWSAWEPVAGTKAWTLSAGNGSKTVYMKLKDAAGNETAQAVTASIELQEPSSSSGDSTPQQSETITVNVENGVNSNGTVVSTALIYRTTDVNGRKKDEVTLTLDQANRTVGQLVEAGSNLARIVIPDTKDEVAELKVTLPKATTERLVNGNVGVEIFTINGRIDIPKSSLEGLKEDVYFRIIPVKAADERKEIEQRAKTEQVVRDTAGNDNISVIGRPVTIETNLQSRPITLVLPLEDESLNEQQLKELGVFIVHSDGTLELVRGEVVSYDDSGKRAIRFTISKFSTFTIVKMEGTKPSAVKQHKAYISGYPDGTFGPERNITRAEMATLLVRISEKAANNASVSYTDVASTHWAKEAVEQAAMMSLMEGYADGSFKPEQTMTRAEMAAIVSQLLNDAPSGDNSFSDAKGHWAQTAIERVKAAGIISGYADGTFRPEQTLTRAEAVTMINKLLGRGPLIEAAAEWLDVPKDYWAFELIQEASVDHDSEH